MSYDKEYAKRWRNANKDKIKGYSKTYREKNKEKIKEYSKTWTENNKEKVKNWNKEYQAKKRKRAETDIDIYVDIIYRGLVDRTNIRNRKGRNHEEIDFDREFLKKKILKSNMICAISGLTMTFKNNDLYKVSIDRKNNNKGYIKSNIQVVAACVNIARQDLTIKKFVEICKAVAKNNA